MGWYARLNAQMMAKRAGVQIPDDMTPEEWRKTQGPTNLGAVGRAYQDERDRQKGEKVARKAERKSRKSGQ